MKKIVKILFVLVVSISLFACNNGSSEKKEVQAITEKFLQSFDKGDYDNCKKFMTKEASKMIDTINQALNTDGLGGNIFTFTIEQKTQLKTIFHQLLDKMIKFYQIGEIKKEGDVYVIDVTFEGVKELDTVLEVFQKKFNSQRNNFIKTWTEKGENEAKKMMASILIKDLQETVDTLETYATFSNFSMKLSVEKVDNKWLICEFSNKENKK
ncbi:MULTISPECIES: hypothetical protein [Terrabacteria group]|uniref:hypothetical protein n=1 Tax=Bacillati TaxID=1783272 RepID=UPI001C6E8562|nr:MULTISPECIES: hypothetical protein [Terrabacteria group]MBW9212963.1 hypothetical protein [Trueperella sp. zg.1013]